MGALRRIVEANPVRGRRSHCYGYCVHCRSSNSWRETLRSVASPDDCTMVCLYDGIDAASVAATRFRAWVSSGPLDRPYCDAACSFRSVKVQPLRAQARCRESPESGGTAIAMRSMPFKGRGQPRRENSILWYDIARAQSGASCTYDQTSQDVLSGPCNTSFAAARIRRRRR